MKTPSHAPTRRAFLGHMLAGCCVAAMPGPEISQDWQPLCGLSAGRGFRRVSGLRDARPEARKMLGLIVDTIGLKPNFTLKEGEFETAAIAFAAVRGNERYLVFDAKEHRWHSGRVTWPDVWIMGHEIGHHLQGHMHLPGDSKPATELEADHFAGFVVGRLGGTLEQAQQVMPMLSVSGGQTHPPRSARARASAAGWTLSQEMTPRERRLCQRE